VGDWDRFREFARRNVILVRGHDVLEREGVPVEEGFAEAVAPERRRIERTVRFIAELGAMCGRHDIEFVFTKAFQHYPDMGHDVDLLVLDRSNRIDSLVGQSFKSVRGADSLINRVAGKTSWEVEGEPTPLEVHHGRLGHVGEHNVYPGILFRRRAQVQIAGITTCVPSPEDQLIVQVLQRIYAHLSLRVSDVVHTARLLGHDMDWDYIVETTRQIGVFGGLCCYLRSVDEICQGLGERAVRVETWRHLGQSGWGNIRLGRWHYRFPVVRVCGRLYGEKLARDLASADWASAGRLLLLPPLAVAAAGRAVLRRAGQGRSRPSPGRKVEGDAEAPV